MATQFHAIYENGVLRPLEPVALPEHQRLSVTVNGSEAPAEDWMDLEAVEAASREADDSISLELVRERLSKIQGSMAEAVIAERDER